jgi:hypothetical protein
MSWFSRNSHWFAFGGFAAFGALIFGSIFHSAYQESSARAAAECRVGGPVLDGERTYEGMVFLLPNGVDQVYCEFGAECPDCRYLDRRPIGVLPAEAP